MSQNQRYSMPKSESKLFCFFSQIREHDTETWRIETLLGLFVLSFDTYMHENLYAGITLISRNKQQK